MISVGLTEMHGIAHEVMANPPDGVQYFESKSTKTFLDRVITSPAKGVLNCHSGEGFDLLEAPLFPIRTKKPWIYTPARFSGATAFELCHVPTPRFLRVKYIEHLMLKDNFIRLIFKSRAGAKTLESYGRITNPKILEKVDVIYPCIRKVDSTRCRADDGKVNFLFSGDFFLKGGANVVDAFERLQSEFSNIYLRICSLPDLRIGDAGLREEYQRRIAKNDHIHFGHVPRNEMLETVLPATDVFVSPTYQEAFGFAVLEASAFGLPVISTNHFAIPEIIDHEKSGYLIDTDQFDFIRKGKVSILKTIPREFHEYMSQQVEMYMKRFIESSSTRRAMGECGRKIAQSKFSFETRNKKMKQIYADALGLTIV